MAWQGELSGMPGLAGEASPETAPAPLESRPRRGMPLFWRTFLLLTLLMLGCIATWVQTFWLLELEPRAVQSAQQLASLVNLSRAGLVNTDPIARIALVKTLVDEENVRIAMRVPSDTFEPYTHDRLSRHVSEALRERLGPETIVAGRVNGFEGMWVGFTIGDEAYWLLADPERVSTADGRTWLVWLAVTVALSLAGAAAVTRLINRPLKELSSAASQLRAGRFDARRLDEQATTSEIREVNRGFNRMAQQLSKAERDRTLMLAGISHDLRTPLSRLRLEAELSVPDEKARAHMAADIEQANQIIDKFMDYARQPEAATASVPLAEVVEAALRTDREQPGLQLKISVPADLRVRADRVDLLRIFSNLLENALRYGKGPDGITRVELAATAREPWILVKFRDRGPGVAPPLLAQLTQPFFRADAARTDASGAGLGLAIVERTIARMGGTLALVNGQSGGLVAQIRLPKA